MRTLDEILQRIHVLLEKDNQYPDSGDEDYEVRTALVQDAVEVWNGEENVLWSELFTTLADASTGDDTTTTDLTYDCPDDFVFLAGTVRLVQNGQRIFFTKIEPHEQQQWIESGQKYCYITGNKSTGFTLHLSEYVATGLTIEYEYYKTVTIPTTGSSEVEMDDPQFCVYWALAELVSDEDPGLSAKYSSIASSKLDAMKLKNNAPSFFQPHTVSDESEGFGA
jgi:hypothetical protein